MQVISVMSKGTLVIKSERLVYMQRFQFWHPTSLPLSPSPAITVLMEGEDQRELQLLPTTSSVHLAAGRTSDSSRRNLTRGETSEPLSLDLQLSISLRPSSGCLLRENTFRGYQEIENEMNSVKALKRHSAEQIRLADMEKAYAERVRELTRREIELAESDFARARHTWERAQEEVEKAERMKEKACWRIDPRCMEITCQACRQRF